MVRYVLAANQGASESITLKMVAICFSETSVLLTKATRHRITEDNFQITVLSTRSGSAQSGLVLAFIASVISNVNIRYM
jgi:hypothetical protein